MSDYTKEMALHYMSPHLHISKNNQRFYNQGINLATGLSWAEIAKLNHGDKLAGGIFRLIEEDLYTDEFYTFALPNIIKEEWNMTNLKLCVKNLLEIIDNKHDISLTEAECYILLKKLVEYIDSQDELLKQLACDNHAAQFKIIELTQREEKFIARINKLEERLEITYCYNGEGEKIEIPPEDRDSYPDGIMCRNETIDLLAEESRKIEVKLQRALKQIKKLKMYSVLK